MFSYREESLEQTVNMFLKTEVFLVYETFPVISKEEVLPKSIPAHTRREPQKCCAGSSMTYVKITKGTGCIHFAVLNTDDPHHAMLNEKVELYQGK